jgi:hypothetical protein
MIDGVSAMDTGNNGLLGGLNLPVDAVAEVKVLTSAYQAEFGRSGGLQISAVTAAAPTSSNGPSSATSGGALREQQVGRGAERLSGPGVAPVRHRLHARRTRRRPAEEPAVLLLQPRISSADGRTLRASHAPADGALERQGDFSETRDANGAAVQPHLRSAVRAAEGGVLGERHVGVLPATAVSSRIRRTACAVEAWPC